MAGFLWNIKDLESRLEGAMKHESRPGTEKPLSDKSTARGHPVASTGGQPAISAEQLRAWHTLSVEEAARSLRADTARGLTNAEAVRRRRQFGPNALVMAKDAPSF